MSTIILSADNQQMKIDIGGTRDNIVLNPYLAHITNAELQRLNIADIRKDAYNATTPVVAGVTVLNNCIINLFGQDPDKSKQTYKTVLKEIVGANIRNTEHDEMTVRGPKPIQSEQVLERTSSNTTQRLYHKTYINESGLGADKVCAEPSKIITIQNPAQALDQGPGGGNFQFPKDGDTLMFDRSFMEAFGFYYTRTTGPQPHPISVVADPLVWEWGAKNDAGGWKYGVNHPNMHPDVGIATTVDELQAFSKGNADKNAALNTGTTTVICQKTLNSYVAFKELGDAMMNAIYIAYCNYIKTHYKTKTIYEICASEGYINGDGSNILTDDMTAEQLIDIYTIMLTCDKTVHFRNILGNQTTGLTCPKDKVITAIIFQKEKGDEKEFVTKMVEMEVNRIKSVINTIVSRWEKEKIFWVNGTMKLKSISIPIKSETNVSALNTAIIALKTEINSLCNIFLATELNDYSSGILPKDVLKDKLINLKESCFVTEFVLPRKIIPIGGGTLPVARGCFLTKLDQIENSIDKISAVNEAMTEYFSKIRGFNGGGVAAGKGGGPIQSGGAKDDATIAMYPEDATYNEMLIFKECALFLKGSSTEPIDTGIVYLLYCRTISYLHLANNVIPKEIKYDEDAEINGVSYDESKLTAIINALNKAFNTDVDYISIDPSSILEPYYRDIMIDANNTLTDYLTTTTQYDLKVKPEEISYPTHELAEEKVIPDYPTILGILLPPIELDPAKEMNFDDGNVENGVTGGLFNGIYPTLPSWSQQPTSYTNISNDNNSMGSNDNSSFSSHSSLSSKNKGGYNQIYKPPIYVSSSLPGLGRFPGFPGFRSEARHDGVGKVTATKSSIKYIEKTKKQPAELHKINSHGVHGRYRGVQGMDNGKNPTRIAGYYGLGGKRKQTRKRSSKKSKTNKKTKKVKKMKKGKQTMKKKNGKKGKKTSRKKR